MTYIMMCTVADRQASERKAARFLLNVGDPSRLFPLAERERASLKPPLRTLSIRRNCNLSIESNSVPSPPINMTRLCLCNTNPNVGQTPILDMVRLILCAVGIKLCKYGCAASLQSLLSLGPKYRSRCCQKETTGIMLFERPAPASVVGTSSS